MPGILPMKVIKVGNSSQSRVAQACDRCRSKKIRCDGVRPCCSQCANVGFECKTSDKLSRRAFPRGYTESLEDRVRSLEAEVRELKGLLDEKDEKIDMLSRLQSFSSPSSRKASPPSSSTTTTTKTTDSTSSFNDERKSSTSSERDDLIRVQHSTSLLRKPTRDSPFTGPSSTKAFIDAFTHKLENSGKSSSTFSTEALLSPPSVPVWRRQDTVPSKTPPRLVSDQLINIFFQEWAPLYPVVHRPTILKLYGHYTTNPEAFQDDKYALAQLNLIFGIAAISSTSRIPQDPAFFEHNWIPKLDALSHDISLSALQCYVLAQIYYMVKADYKTLLKYRGLAVGICHQLGLHQSQKRFSFNPLSSETRKKVFWCQYVLDRFAAALTGLPVLMAESDICVEYPADVDDENVTETGFVPTLPGELTRVSSALALFGATRILNSVLDRLYPSPAGYQVSLSTIHSLAEELEEWQKNLPAHLRLDFVQDKPSTNVTGSRSPLLSLMFYFIRTLIRRPAVCFAQPNTASPSLLALVDSGKHIIQILELLEERRLCLSLSLNKRELIFVSSLGLLWQSMDLGRDCKLVKEGQKLLTAASALLECDSAEAATEFNAILNVVCPAKQAKCENSDRGAQQVQEMRAPSPKAKSQNKLQAPKPRPSISANSENNNSSKSTAPMRKRSPAGANSRSPELSQRSVRSPSTHSLSSSINPELVAITPRSSSDLPPDLLNLDYLPLGDGKGTPSSSHGPGFTMSDWEHILSDMDNGHSNIYTGIYGGGERGDVAGAFPPGSGAAFPHSSHAHAPPSLHNLQGWSPETWPSSGGSDLHSNNNNSSNNNNHHPANPAHSVMSYSDASPSSVDDFSRHADAPTSAVDGFDGIVIPHNLTAIESVPRDYSVVDSWGTTSCSG
ncbi:hypothetical protein AJ80_06107 [Polytolypa hystricis UAMH7299]|uniref:Zn(2)-C6 fungal-type domain-containing protein n=1 Tax=Polytolypa hystricis (strain UAMH7299) TaxID=1447883 RepID=A0A2B7XZR6_POLH7|nr:hypothetical protein AJ80_06107 [Polytolypa hystricis UAMH7299]